MEVGTIVNVKFDDGEWYTGTVTTVKRRNGSDVHKICIVYEDGGGEECNWPDDDIIVLGKELMPENMVANGGGGMNPLQPPYILGGEQRLGYTTYGMSNPVSSHPMPIPIRSAGVLSSNPIFCLPLQSTRPLQQVLVDTSSSTNTQPLGKTPIQMEEEIAKELLNLRHEESTATTSTTSTATTSTTCSTTPSISPNEQPEYRATTVFVPKVEKKSTKQSTKSNKPELLYSCGFENCNFAAKIRSNTKRHRANIHDIQVKWNVCEVPTCNFKCKQKSQLKTHQANIHDINVSWYSCEFCSFKSKERGSVKRHSLNIHDTSRDTTVSWKPVLKSDTQN